MSKDRNGTNARTFLAVSFCCFLGSPGFAADWPQFRGPHTNGIAAGDAGPSSLKRIAWKEKLPGRGLSGPIVVSGRVFLTASSGYDQDRLHVLCFDGKTGKQQWQRQFWATGRTQCHRKMCVATPTPASDGKRIFAMYSSNDLACLDLDGNLLWYRGLGHDFPNASNSLGMASSPVVVGKTVVVQVESDAEAFATGINVETGVARWKVQRPRRANWTSAAVMRHKTRGDLVLLQSSKGLAAVKAASGKEVWKYDDGASTIPSSSVVGNTVYVPSHGVTALRPVPGGSAPELIWREDRLAPSVASPIAYRGSVFSLNRVGVLSAGNAGTGKIEGRVRLTGPFSGSPVAAGGRLYFFNEKGLGFIVEVPGGGKKGRVVEKHEFAETFLCTPAISNNALYIRSDKHLLKIGG